MPPSSVAFNPSPGNTSTSLMKYRSTTLTPKVTQIPPLTSGSNRKSTSVLLKGKTVTPRCFGPEKARDSEDGTVISNVSGCAVGFSMNKVRRLRVTEDCGEDLIPVEVEEVVGVSDKLDSFDIAMIRGSKAGNWSGETSREDVTRVRSSFVRFHVMTSFADIDMLRCSFADDLVVSNKKL